MDASSLDGTNGRKMVDLEQVKRAHSPNTPNGHGNELFVVGTLASQGTARLLNG